MSSKLKKGTVVATATMISVTSVMSPVTLYAQEENTPQEITENEITEKTTNSEEPFPQTETHRLPKDQQEGEETNKHADPIKEQKSIEEPVMKPALLSKNSAAQPTSTDVIIDDTNFPDVNFRQYVQTKFDLDDNQSLSQDEINKIQSIYISKDANLKSLKGIELFPELLELTCSYTGITELDVTKNAKLTKLNCENTQISSLDVRNNPALDTIFCQHTKITELDVTQNGNLRILDCSSLNMTSLDVSQNSHLLELHINNTNLSWMNLGDHPNLHVLHQRVDQMKHVRNDLTQSFYIQDVVEGIDISKVYELDNCMYSTTTGRVTVYNLDKPIKYQYLCGRVGNSNFYIYVTLETMIDINEVNFPDDAFRQYILDECDISVKDGKLSPREIQNVKVVDIKGKTEIKDLTGIEKFVNLEWLDCSDTGLTSLDVSKNTNLRVLAYTDTELQWLDVGTNPNLTIAGWAHRTIYRDQISDTFNLQDVLPGIDPKKVTITSNGTLDQNTSEITVTDPYQPVVYSYYCGEAKGQPYTLTGTIESTINIDQTNFPDDHFRQYLIDTYDKYPTDGMLSTSEIVTIQTIDISGKTEIKDLTGIEHFANLEELICTNSGILSLDLTKNSKLRILNCIGTNLLWLNVGVNPNLTRIELPTPTVYRASMDPVFQLQDLSKDIDLQKITIVSNAIFDHTTGEVKVHDIQQPIAYSYQCGEANGKQIILKGRIESIIEIDPYNFPDATFRNFIKGFDLDDNQKLSFDEVNQVTSMTIDYTVARGINDLKGLEFFENLEVFDCRYSNISSIDISNLEKLTYIDIRNCKRIQKIDVSNNKKLTHLNVSLTQIQSLDIENNEKLTYLDANTTPLQAINVINNKELTFLNVSNTLIQTIDVSQNKLLKELECSSTKIKEINVDQNTKLETLSCGSTGIKNLNVNKNADLKYLECHNTEIAKLDLTNNKVLEQLGCYNNPNLTQLILNCASTLTHLYISDTEISSLDVSNYTALDQLDCSRNMNLNLLNVSGTVTLRDFYCNHTNIKELDLSDSISLRFLACEETGIKSLDLTNSKLLNGLYCDNTPLAWLKLDNLNLVDIGLPSSTININVNDDTFNIAKHFEGIDPSKVTITSNGIIDPKTGIVSGYQMGTPIQYSYDCGVSSRGPETLYVTLILAKSDRTISFVDTLDQTYTGKPINDPKVTFTGSGTTAYSYEAWNGKAWENLSTNPVNVGKYRVTAYIPADEYNNEVSIAEEFDITQATNTWIKKPDIQDWTYKGTVPQPTGEAAFGMKGISFTYSSSEQGPFDSKVPEAAGIWYMKASVGGTENYTGLEEIIAFEIKKAKAPAIQIPGNLRGVHDDQLFSVALLPRWYWADGTQILDIDTTGYVALLDVDDQNYDYRNVEGYDGHGHIVKTLQVSVDPATNIWIETPTIKDWAYGETASSPSASAKYGNDLIKYTYSKSPSGPFTNDVPENAGTWYMKATIEGTKHYEKLESNIISFVIRKAKAPAISMPSNLNGVKGNLLSTIQLPKDWSWTNPNETLDQNKVDYLARLRVDGLNYDYSQVNGYDSAGSYVEVALPVVVSSATNSWAVGPSIKGWVYGETKNQPVATPKYGKVTITYSQSPMDGFTTDQPENAGRWYMKASVAATKDYTGLEEIVGFEIKKAAAPVITQPDQLRGVYDDKLSSVVLENGWYWGDGDQILDTDTTGYLARLDVDDHNYDYSKVEGYNAKEHCIERALTIAVSPTTNAWIQAPSISDWTYGKQASTPTGKAQYGDIRFTYSNAETGTFTDQVPRDAGTWYMKASVTDTKEYTGLTSIQKFTIAPMNIEDNENITISDIKKEEDVKHLVVKDGDEELVKDKDYEVTETQRGHMGIVTIRFKGNYAGTIIKSYPKTIVATGDSTNTGLLATMSLLSTGCLALLTGKNRRNKRKQRG